MTCAVWLGIRIPGLLVTAFALTAIASGCRAPSDAKSPIVRDSRHVETEVTFTSDGLKLYGVVDEPREHESKIPGVVLVHGSGPVDRDSTVAAQKPFLDIGRGLAERGIAVLRYDKRTLTYGATWTVKNLSKLTVEDEILDDALSAARFLREREGVDAERVFVLGHSLGGWAAPIIAKQDPKIAGIIMLAPSAADFEQTLICQLRYRAEVTDTPQATVDAQISKIERLFADLRAGKLADDTPMLGATAHYWRDFLSRDPAKDIMGIPQPVLILQGEKDYQVTIADDLPIWEKALKESRKAEYTIVRFPDLNHLFMRVEGESTGNEYSIPAHVDAEVIDTIAGWIKGRE